MSVAAALTLIGGALLYVGLRLLTALAEKEVEGWIPLLSNFVLRRAARRLPGGDRARYMEEWRADLAEFADRPLTGLAFAVRIRVGARALARELVLAPAAEAADGSSAAPPAKRQWVHRFQAVARRSGRSGSAGWINIALSAVLVFVGQAVQRAAKALGRTTGASIERLSVLVGAGVRAVARGVTQPLAPWLDAGVATGLAVLTTVTAALSLLGQTSSSNVIWPLLAVFLFFAWSGRRG